MIKIILYNLCIICGIHVCTTCNLGNLIDFILYANKKTQIYTYIVSYIFLHTSKAEKEREISIMTEREGRSLSPLINPDNTLSTANKSSKKVRRCFKPRYRLRRVKNRGAILILIWSYCISSLYFYISYTASRVYGYLVFALIQISAGFMIPLAGWLADIRFGRYKVIHFSMRTMWISSLLLTASLIISQSLDLHNLSMVLHLFLLPLGVGYGGFQANIIQFGVDQLCDASSTEIKTFVVLLDIN